MLIFTLTSHSFADEVFTVIIKRQEEKAASRWTLSDWLMTKQRISLMDQWLSLNTESNLFDFSLSYEKLNFKQTFNQTSTNVNDNNLNTKFFVSFIGLEASREFSKSIFENTSYSLNLKLLGSSLQSTNLQVKYGISKIESNFENKKLSYNTKFFETEANVYLLGFVGVSYKYNNTFKSIKDSTEYSKKFQNYGVFLDMWIFKFYIEKIHQTHLYDGQKIRDKGEKVGISLLF